MKKIKWINLLLVLTLLVVPMFLLSACDEVQYFKVFAQSSNPLKNVSGPDGQSNIAEGTQITLSTNDDDFICWVHNERQVISIDNLYTFNLNKENSGVYTGVFAESYQTMNYFALTNIKIDLVGFTQYQVNLNIIPSQYSIEKEVLYQGGVENANQNVYSGRVFSFLNEQNYYLEIEILYNFDQNQNPQKVLIEKHLDLKNSDFNSDGSLVLSTTLQNEEDSAILTLDFKKLDLELAQSTFEKV